MQKKAIAEYYKFGTSVRYLQDAKQGYPIDHPMGILHNLKLFFGHLDNLDLHVTKRLTDDLKIILDELSLSPENSRLSGEQANRLNAAISDIRKTLGAELMGVYAFVITPKIIDTSKLLDAVPSLFGSGVFDSLPEIARYDFTEAARCIAFERATAASFHTLRGTEMALRQFYCSLIKQKRIKSLMWGPIVSDLRKRPKAEKYTVLLNHLDHIRHSFRNPTQHPEKMYDIQESQDLWSLCVDATNRMHKITGAP